MRKQLTRLLWLALLVLMMPACSWFKEKPPEYMESEEVAPLAVPDDLDAPVYRTPLVITAPEMRRPSGDELNPGPPRVTTTAGRNDQGTAMSWSAEGVYLSVQDSAESVDRRLGFTIERSGMNVLDPGADGSKRFEYRHVRYDERSFWQKLAFWNNDSGPDYSGIYRTRVVPDGEKSRVYLYLDSGAPAPTNAAEHVLGIFMERLG